MSLSDRIRPNSEAAQWVVDEVKVLEGKLAAAPSFTEAERRILLDLIDEEHARDRRTFEIGRTTIPVFADQQKMYAQLRRKLVGITPVESPAGLTSGD